MKEKVKAASLRYKREIKKALHTAIVAAFGFLIALTWKDVIVEYVNTIVSLSPVGGKLISAIVITLIGVLGILIVTRIFEEKVIEK